MISKKEEPAYIAPEDFVWTVKSLAEHNHCGKNTILNLIYSGKLKAYSISGDINGKKNWRITQRSWLRYTNGPG